MRLGTHLAPLQPVAALNLLCRVVQHNNLAVGDGQHGAAIARPFCGDDATGPGAEEVGNAVGGPGIHMARRGDDEVVRRRGERKTLCGIDMVILGALRLS